MTCSKEWHRQYGKKYYQEHKQETKDAARRWEQANRERRRKLRSKWISENKDKHDAYRRKYQNEHHYLNRYGITRTERDLLIKAQNNTCPICELEFTSVPVRLAVVDHDHRTGKVRAMLCASCNLVLGKIGESIKTLYRAVDYLEKYQ